MVKVNVSHVMEPLTGQRKLDIRYVVEVQAGYGMEDSMLGK